MKNNYDENSTLIKQQQKPPDKQKAKAKLAGHQNKECCISLNISFCVLPQPTMYSFVSILVAGAHRWNTAQLPRPIYLTYCDKGRYGRRSENEHRKHVVLIVKYKS